MIDKEIEIFNYVAVPLRAEFSGIYIIGEATSSPSQFPAVTFVEKSNTVRRDARDFDNIENQANVMYEVNVYSNLTSGKKQQAKNIFKLIDSKMSTLGFERTFGQPIENLADTTIYRYTARYIASIGKDNYVYGGK